MISDAFAQDVIPSWVKNTAGWWATDAISETEFVNAIEFLVKENIIQVNVSQTSQLPDWLVNNAGWWAARIFTNSDFDFDPEYVKEKIYTSFPQCMAGRPITLGYVVSCPEVTYNSYGFRGSEFEAEKPDNTYRIFAVGGSSTFGRGVDNSETWPVYLQQIINEKITDPEFSGSVSEIEVINAGFPQAASGVEHSLIKIKLSSFDPDLIIMYDGWNDAIQGGDIEETLQNWERVCKLGKDEGFNTIIIVQSLPTTGLRVLTEQEIEYSSPNLGYLQKFQPYVDGFKELESCSKTFDFRRIFDYIQAPIFYDSGHTLGFGNKIIAENVFSVIAPSFGKTYSVIHNNLSSENNKPETGVVYAVGSDLSNRNFDNLNLQNAVFDKADLSNTSFKNTNIDGARFVFANLNNSNLLDQIDLSNINLANVDLSNTNLKGKNLSGTILTGTNLTNAILTEADLTDAVLYIATLTDANFENAILTGAVLKAANLANANFKNANLRITNFDTANLANADLSGANLRNANLTSANLEGANLQDAILDNANLSGANLNCLNHPICN